MMRRYCTRCGYEFDALGREVICPACREAAAAETKRRALLKTKRASWTGESVPVRVSGRASTIIREYGAAHNLPFASALDALLQASDYFASAGKAWEAVTPYKSHRRDKTTSTAANTAQDAKQEVKQEVKPAKQDAKQEVKQEVKPAKQDAKQEVKQASKATASKATASKATASKATASKATASKASSSKASKARG